MIKPNIILLILSLISTFIFINIFVDLLIENLRIRQVNNRNFEKSLSKNVSILNQLILRLFINGIPRLSKISNFLISRSSKIKNFIDKVYNICQQKKVQTSCISILSILILIMLVLFFIVLVIFQSYIVSLAVILCLIVCFVSWVNNKYETSKSSIRYSIPDTLRSMSSCLSAGYSLQQTFHYLSEQSKSALSEIYKKSSTILKSGGSINASLDNLRSKDNTEELNFVAVALAVQHQTGGSVAPVIESVKDVVESKLELLKSLKVQTSQARLSARIVTVLPFILVAVFSIVSPNFLTPFFSSFVGIIVLCVACCMQLIGIFLVRKMLRVSL